MFTEHGTVAYRPFLIKVIDATNCYEDLVTLPAPLRVVSLHMS